MKKYCPVFNNTMPWFWSRTENNKTITFRFKAYWYQSFIFIFHQNRMLVERPINLSQRNIEYYKPKEKQWNSKSLLKTEEYSS